MKKQLTIAIYTGTIPSSPFIEHQIKAIAEHHQVLLFGTKTGTVTYTSKHISIIETPVQQWRNIPITLFRTLRLLLKKPKHVRTAYKEAMTYAGAYQKWMRFSRFIPVLLYEPDIFHIQWAVKLERWLFLKQAYGCKIVLSLLGTHINISPRVQGDLKRTYERYFPEVDAFHAVSHALAQEAILYGARPERLHVIHSVVSQTAIDLFKLPSAEPKAPLHLLSVGRHHWVKGYPYALQAINMLKDRDLAVTYTIIAPNAPSEELLFLVEDLGLQRIVNFKPSIPQDDLFGVMQDFDVLLQPSVSEGIANVVLEAMAVGLAVISTNCGGMAEVVIPEQTGWLVPMRSPEAIRDAVLDYIKTPSKSKDSLLTNAHHLIAENFNSKRIGEEFSLLYEPLNQVDSF